jgi:hypothetical protein
MNTDLRFLGEAVQRNCHISDARHARSLSLCTYLLKMREFYRWEMRYPFSRSLPARELGAWVDERERLWDELEEQPFGCVPAGGQCRDPFDAESINGCLVAGGLVYSAGYGRAVRPHFYVARLLRHEALDGFDVYVSGEEYARDIAAPVAMTQGRSVFVRRESVRRLLWERVE